MFNEENIPPVNQHEFYYDGNDDLLGLYLDGEDVDEWNFNEILVYVGSSDLKNAKKEKAEMAFVMETIRKEANDRHPSLLSGYDIGLVIMEDELNEKKIKNFMPICLPQRYILNV